MTALSELVLANFSAVFRLMKPKPYESSNDPLHPVCHEGRCSCAPVCADKFRALPDVAACAGLILAPPKTANLKQ